MPLPLLGFAVRSVAMGIAKRQIASLLTPAASAPKLTFKLARGGRGIAKRGRKIRTRTRAAAVKASNTLGKRVRVEARESLAAQFDVSPATIRRIEKAQAAFRGSKSPAYTVYYRQTRMPVQRVRSLKFRRGRGRGAGARGTLTFKLWRGGRKIVLRGVLKRGRNYVLQATRKLPERAVGGPRASPRSRPVRAALNPIRKRIRKRFKREFRRQLKALPRR